MHPLAALVEGAKVKQQISTDTHPVKRRIIDITGHATEKEDKSELKKI